MVPMDLKPRRSRGVLGRQNHLADDFDLFKQYNKLNLEVASSPKLSPWPPYFPFHS